MQRDYQAFDSSGYEALVEKGEKLYRSDPARFQAALSEGIQASAAWSRAARLPVVTTECWGVIDYKDWPLLNWDWVKDLCERGVTEAAATGRWAGIATSNFCGPQFVGMWRDVPWHQRLTTLIKNSPLDPELRPG